MVTAWSRGVRRSPPPGLVVRASGRGSPPASSASPTWDRPASRRRRRSAAGSIVTEESGLRVGKASLLSVPLVLLTTTKTQVLVYQQRRFVRCYGAVIRGPVAVVASWSVGTARRCAILLRY